MPTSTRVLKIRHGWLELILLGVKKWELRHGKCRPGPVLLYDVDRRAITGTALITECVPLSADTLMAYYFLHWVPLKAFQSLHHKRPHAWVLRCVRRLQPCVYTTPGGRVVWGGPHTWSLGTYTCANTVEHSLTCTRSYATTPTVPYRPSLCVQYVVLL